MEIYRKFFLNLKALLIQDTNSVYFCGSHTGLKITVNEILIDPS